MTQAERLASWDASWGDGEARVHDAGELERAFAKWLETDCGQRCLGSVPAFAERNRIVAELAFTAGWLCASLKVALDAKIQGTAG